MIFQTFILMVVIANVLSHPVFNSELKGIQYPSSAYSDEFYVVPHQNCLTFAPQFDTVYRKDKDKHFEQDVQLLHANTIIPSHSLLPGQSVLQSSVVPTRPVYLPKPISVQPTYSGSNIIIANDPYKDYFTGVAPGAHTIVPVRDNSANLLDSLIKERELLNSQLEYLSAYKRPIETNKAH